MPKRSQSTRGNAQRNKAKVQKNFELVRPTIEEQPGTEEEGTIESQPVPAAASVSTAARARTSSPSPRPAEPATPIVEQQDVAEVITAPKGSASARLAARRQAAQRAQQRNAASLITSEHFAYVRRDLITIAILAGCMLAIIIILYVAFGSTL